MVNKEDNTTGPIYPVRDFSKTNLPFVPIRVFSEGDGKGFGQIDLPEALRHGIICGIQAVHWVDGLPKQFIGSGVFVAPGVVISAWHVFVDFFPKNLNGAMKAEFQVYSLFGGPRTGKALIWPIESWSLASYKNEGSDVTVLTCSLFGEHPTQKVHHQAILSGRMPILGEIVTVIGLKELELRNWHEHTPLINFFMSRGKVIDLFPKGRGPGLPGPCFAIDTGATGGMSGAAVFDSQGAVIGILSTGVDSNGDNAYSIISSISPALKHDIDPSWIEEAKKGKRKLEEYDLVQIV